MIISEKVATQPAACTVCQSAIYEGMQMVVVIKEGYALTYHKFGCWPIVEDRVLLGR